MRVLEKQYPKIFVLCTLLICYIFQDYLCLNLTNKLDKIFNATLALSGIFLSFVGVMYGVLLSLKNSKVMELLSQYNGTADLKSYLREAFIADWIALFYSLIYLIFSPQDYINVIICTNLVIMIYMITTSYRMISLLSKLVDISYGENNKRFDRKIHMPKFK